MRLIILIGTILITTMVCVAMSVDASGFNEDAAKFAVCFGPLLGFFTGWLLLGFIGSKPRRRRPRPTPRPRPAPRSRPFVSRLARFTDQEESQVMADSTYHSNMPFWVATDTFTKTRPKPASLIRRVLERIRSLVRK